MRNKIVYFLLVVFFVFVFTILYKGLSNPSLYKPNASLKKIPEFTAETFTKQETLNSKYIFNQNKFYLLNIWASWCVPCRDEHPLLINLGKNNKIEIIGLNYKDNFKNAEKFINDLGNPYSTILLDRDGTKAIEWGAFGVPESFLIYNNKVLEKYVGPLNQDLVKKIKLLIR